MSFDLVGFAGVYIYLSYIFGIRARARDGIDLEPCRLAPGDVLGAGGDRRQRTLRLGLLPGSIHYFSRRTRDGHDAGPRAQGHLPCRRDGLDRARHAAMGADSFETRGACEKTNWDSPDDPRLVICLVFRGCRSAGAATFVDNCKSPHSAPPAEQASLHSLCYAFLPPPWPSSSAITLRATRKESIQAGKPQ